MKWSYYITETGRNEVSVFGSGGAGWMLMYGPFDLRNVYDREDLERWKRSLDEWGYQEVPAPTLGEHMRRVRS